MSDTLTSQERTALEEMPNALEMGELRKTATLQDIPLAEGNNSMQQIKISHQAANEDNEKKLKTNSLKRFLRLSSKKKCGDGSLEVEESDIAFKEAHVTDADHSHKDLTGSSLSKATLKSSLSSYWNSMFKQKKTGKSSKTTNDFELNVLGASCSVNMENRLPRPAIEEQESVCNLEEEIQSLKISQEFTQK